MLIFVPVPSQEQQLTQFGVPSSIPGFHGSNGERGGEAEVYPEVS